MIPAMGLGASAGALCLAVGEDATLAARVHRLLVNLTGTPADIIPEVLRIEAAAILREIGDA